MSKITVDTKELRKELMFVCSTIDVSPTNAHWTSVLLEVSDKENLTIKGTNGVNAAKSSVKLTTPIDGELAICLPAKKFLDLVRLFTADTTSISVAETKVTIMDGKGRYGYRLSPESIAHIKPFTSPTVTGTASQMSAAAFASVLAFAQAFAADEESTKFTLAGIKVEGDEASLKARAMDGHRAIDITIADPSEGRNESLWLPNEASALLMAFGDTGQPVSVVKSDAYIVLSSGPRVVYVRRSFAENPPSVAKLLDNYISQNSATADVDSQDVLLAVKKLQTASDGKYRLVRFKIQDKVLKLTARDAVNEMAEFESEIDAVTTGEGEFSLNSGYVVQVLKNLNGVVTFRAGSASNPAVITNNTGIRSMISQMK